MPNLHEYRLKINGVTPETLPLLRLSEYLKTLVEVLGSGDKLHLLRMDRSSAVPVVGIESQEAIKVERRVLAIRTGGGPANARRAYEQFNAALAQDGCSAVLLGPTKGQLIEFPGNKQPRQEPSAGPVTDEAVVDGEVVQISGRDETISVYVRRERQEQICTGSRAQGKELAKFLFSDVRIFGIGRWIRGADGEWELEDVQIKTFISLQPEKLSDTIERLHQIKSEAVAAIPDPTKFIADIRS